MSIKDKFYQSMSQPRLHHNPIYFKLLEHHTEFEAIQILRKYQIGTSTDGKAGFWFFNQKQEPTSVMVGDTFHYGIPQIWNLPLLLSNEPFRKVGYCSTPEDAFWANIYLRQEALWLYVSTSADTTILEGLDCIAIIDKDDFKMMAKIREFAPYCKFSEFSNLGQELQLAGKPTPYIIPPRCKPFDSSAIQKLEHFMDNPAVKMLYEKLSLEIV